MNDGSITTTNKFGSKKLPTLMKFVIEVIAENGTKNEYIINVFKEVKRDIADNNGDFNINKKDNTLKRILIIGISIIILTNITYFLIKIIKKRKKEN